MMVVDSDGHVHESLAMFSLLEKDYYPRRPLALRFETDTAYESRNAVWFIDGMTYPKMVGKGGVIFNTPTLMEKAQQEPVSIGAQEMTDIEARLNDMDKMGVHYQIVYPTLFLTTTTDDIKFEAALYRCYNSFMADACSKSGGRIRFAALVPIRDIEESKRELRRAKGLGATSVMLLGMAWDKTLGDRNLFPFYEEAARLEIPVCVHFGWGCPAIRDIFEPFNSFITALLPVVFGFYTIMASGVLDTIPKLKLAFLESGSSWVPFVLQQLRRGEFQGLQLPPGVSPSQVERQISLKDPAEYFRQGRVYVACETDEDINYLVQWVGPDSVVAFSDYPHTDLSQERNLTRVVMAREDVPLRVREKILVDNPRRLYGLQ